MPRKARIDYAGLTHHVMARTFDQFLLFRDDEDRSFFLECLARRILETNVRCYAWVLMDTHYHLLIKTSELPLWQLMKPLNTQYAHYYNRKYNRRGPLFSDRYKSIATQDQLYVEQLVRYIHLNPLRAGICSNLAALARYTWSGHRYLVTSERNEFQDSKTVLARFGRTSEMAINGYVAFLGSQDDEMVVVEGTRRSNSGLTNRHDPSCWVIGDSEFQKEVLERDRKNRLAIAKYRKSGLTLEQIANKVGAECDVEIERLLCRSKRTPAAQARKLFCARAVEAGFPTSQIGLFLGIQQSAVTNSARSGRILQRDRQTG